MNRPTTATEAPGSGRRILCRPTALALLAVLVLELPSPSEAVRRRAFVTSVTGTGALSTWPDSGGHSGLVGGDAICRARAAAAGLPRRGQLPSLALGRDDRRLLPRPGPDRHAGGGLRRRRAGPLRSLVSIRRRDRLRGKPGRADRTPAGDLPRGARRRVRGTGLIERPCLDRHGRRRHRSRGQELFQLGIFVGAGVGTLRAGDHNRSGLDVQLVDALLLHARPALSRARCERSSGSRLAGTGLDRLRDPRRGTGDLSSWPIAGEASGLAAGDAICRNSAAAAHLPAPESFVAWLSDITVDARDRLTSNGPFRRPDGVEVAASEAYLENGWNPESIHQHEDGGYQADEGGGVAHTGTDSAGLDSGHDCLGWTFDLPAQTGTTGTESSIESESWTDAHETGCHISSHLYCFSNATILFWDGFDLTGDTSRWSSVAP